MTRRERFMFLYENRLPSPNSATEPLKSRIAMIESREITASAYLVVASTGSWCDIHAFVLGAPVVIGRGGANQNQIVLHSDRCSRRHCEIFSEHGNWSFET